MLSGSFLFRCRMSVHPSRQEADMARKLGSILSFTLVSLLAPMAASGQAIREAAPLPGTARVSARAVLIPDRQQILLYGGVSIGGALEDLWRYDLATGHWEPVLKTDPWPGPRAAHSMATDVSVGGFFLYGGRFSDH